MPVASPYCRVRAACLLHLQGLRLFFPLGYTASEFTETARAFDRGHVRPEMLVSDILPLEALPATLEAMRGGQKSLKVHVDPRRSATL